MSPRFAPLIVASVVVLLVAACGAEAAVAPRTAAPVAVTAPTPTPVPAPTRVPTAVPAAPEPTPTPSRNAGDVDGSGGGPQLTVEFPGANLIDVTLADPGAKAWRVVVAGTGKLDQDRLEVVVETGDVGPVITATEIQQGDVVGTVDMSMMDPTSAAGGCHRTLNVCVDSSSFRLPADDSGVLAVRLRMPDQTTHLLVTGGTAGWPSEPFVLGPWSNTETFPWGEG